MNEYHTQMDKHGRLLIPSVIRNTLNYKPGDSFIIRTIDGELRIISIMEAVKNIQAMIKNSTNELLVDKFIQSKRLEAENENLKFNKDAN